MKHSLRSNGKKRWASLGLLFSMALGTPALHAQISLTPAAMTYTQNFNTFKGDAATATSELTGWTLSANSFRDTACGNATQGGIYAFGEPGSGDYSLGFQPVGSSPNNSFTATANFVNNTGVTLGTITISYNFERWRPAPRINGFVVTSDLGDVSALNETGPGEEGTACAVIATPKTVTLTGLSIPDGATFFVTFSGDRGAGTGASQGVAIDDFVLSATPQDAPALTFGTLTAFDATCVGDTSDVQSVAVNGSNLLSPVTVSAPAGFLISDDANGPFQNTLVLTPVAGALSAQMYVAFAPVSGVAYDDQITFTSNAMTAATLEVSGAGSQANPAIAISLDHDLVICEGTVLTFTAELTEGGTTPQVNWLVNNTATGVTTPTFVTSSLDSGDVVTATLLSSEGCAADTAVASNAIAVAIFPVVTPTIAINATPSGPIEPGTSVTFTSTVTGVGMAPDYVWLVNGDSVASGPAYTSDALADGDQVQAILNTDAPCATDDSVLSNQITIEVSTGIRKVSQSTLLVVPNPSHGSVQLKGQLVQAGTTARLQLSNMLGQQVYHTTLPVINGRLEQNLTLGTLPAGLYILSIESGEARQHLRLEIRK